MIFLEGNELAKMYPKQMLSLPANAYAQGPFAPKQIGKQVNRRTSLCGGFFMERLAKYGRIK